MPDVSAVSAAWIALHTSNGPLIGGTTNVLQQKSGTRKKEDMWELMSVNVSARVSAIPILSVPLLRIPRFNKPEAYQMHGC